MKEAVGSSGRVQLDLDFEPNLLSAVSSPKAKKSLGISDNRNFSQSLISPINRSIESQGSYEDYRKALEKAAGVEHQTKTTDTYFTVRKLNRYEEIDNMQSEYPLLELRKALLRVKEATRELCRVLVSSRSFEWFITGVIFLNIIAMSLENPLVEEQEPYLQQFENLVLYIYTAEAFIKMLAQGLVVGKKTYFRETWNILDFLIVVSGWMDYFADEIVNLAALRSVRLLRPLRSIASVRALRVVFEALIGSLKPLFTFTLILMFFLGIFAIMGLHTLAGTFKMRCLDMESGVLWDEVCGNRKCVGNSECVKGLDNPNWGVTNFDNIFSALIAVFKCVTLEGWTEVMNDAQRALGSSAVFLFLPLVVLGSFFILNLVIAVINSEFNEAMNSVKGEPEEKNSEVQENLATETIIEMLINKQHQKYSDNSQTEPKQTNYFSTINSGEAKQVSGLMRKETKVFTDQELKAQIREDFTVSSKSSQDVVPEELGVQLRKSQTYKFKYENEAPHLEFESIDLEESESLRQPVRTKFEVFNSLSKKYGCQGAFEAVNCYAKNSVEETFATDRKQLVVVGKWSGFQVSNNDSKNLEFVRKLSEMELALWESGLKGALAKMSSFLKSFVDSSGFRSTILVCIILNTAVLSVDHYGAPEDLKTFVYLTNLVFTFVFVAEMALKLFGYGLRGYFGDFQCCFDATVVVLSLLEVLLFEDTTSSVSAFKTIKTLSLLRVAKLFSYLEPLTRILNVLADNFSNFVSLGVFLGVFLVVFALLGMEMFGGKFNFEEGVPKANFDSFNWSFVTVFQLLTMENWPDVLYSAVRSEMGYFGLVFFFLWIFLGNFLILNMFLAILLESFSEPQEEEAPKDSKKKTIIRNIREKSRIKRLKQFEKVSNLLHNQELDSSEELTTKRNFWRKNSIVSSAITEKKTCFVLRKQNKLRKFCIKLCRSENFDRVVLALIVLSTMNLVWDTYLLNASEDSQEAKVSYYFDVAIVVAFIVEVLVKVTATGFVLEKGTYLRNKWNQLDFLIVVVSLVEVVFLQELKAVKAFRLLRALRPLRFISQNMSMRVVVKALFQSILALLNVMIVILIIWLLFAILGVSLFGGKFYSCENRALETQFECEEYGYTWVKAYANFDNVLESMLTLWIVSSLEGWPDIMYDAVEATGPYSAYYFVSFILVSCFVLLNLLVGVIFEQFVKAKNDESSFTAFLTKPQRTWVELQQLIPQSSLESFVSGQIENKLVKFCHSLAKSKKFELFIVVCIALNMVQMAMFYEGAPSTYLEALELLNLAFTCVLVSEVVVKVVGLGFKKFFKQKWNCLDLFVVVCSVVDLILNYSIGEETEMIRIGPQLLLALRTFRAFRLFKAAKLFDSIEGISIVAYNSLPGILNVLSIFTLILVVYSILGANLFHGIRGKELDEYTNFDNFGMAVLALFRVATGENWHHVMFDTMKHRSYSVCLIYFLSFVVMTSFIMLNIFLMVVVQSYEDYKTNPDSIFRVFVALSKEFKTAWKTNSESTKNSMIHYKKLPDFMYEVGFELGVTTDEPYEGVWKVLLAMDLKANSEGYLFYNDVLYGVFKRKFGRNVKKGTNRGAKNYINQKEHEVVLKLNKLRKKKTRTNTELVPLGVLIMKDRQKKKTLDYWRNWVESRNSISIELEFPDEISIIH